MVQGTIYGEACGGFAVLGYVRTGGRIILHSTKSIWTNFVLLPRTKYFLQF